MHGQGQPTGRNFELKCTKDGITAQEVGNNGMGQVQTIENTPCLEKHRILDRNQKFNTVSRRDKKTCQS